MDAASQLPSEGSLKQLTPIDTNIHRSKTDTFGFDVFDQGLWTDFYLVPSRFLLFPPRLDYGMICTMWHGMIWHGMVWYGVVWCWYALARRLWTRLRREVRSWLQRLQLSNKSELPQAAAATVWPGAGAFGFQLRGHADGSNGQRQELSAQRSAGTHWTRTVGLLHRPGAPKLMFLEFLSSGRAVSAANVRCSYRPWVPSLQDGPSAET